MYNRSRSTTCSLLLLILISASTNLWAADTSGLNIQLTQADENNFSLVILSDSHALHGYGTFTPENYTTVPLSLQILDEPVGSPIIREGSAGTGLLGGDGQTNLEFWGFAEIAGSCENFEIILYQRENKSFNEFYVASVINNPAQCN
ncbi:MAG: hypothetical protein Tsb002_17510 [Wenzhouxiangellaceae bacterium]